MTQGLKYGCAIWLLTGATALGAQVSDFDQITVGSVETRDIDTNLDGFPVPADIGQIYIGNTTESADAITIDAGGTFPPGISFRRYVGDETNPSVVTPGTQLGYLDFRGFSGSQFWNAASLDVVVDPLIAFSDGGLMPTKMRFAVSNGTRVYAPMELLSNGRLELGAFGENAYAGPGALGDPRLYVNSFANEWATIITGRPEAGPGYALRAHTLGETQNDYIIGGSSGVGAGSFKFSVRGNGDVFVGGRLVVGDVDVLDAIDDAQAGSSQFLAVNAPSGAAAASGTNAVAVGSIARANGSTSAAFGHNAVASSDNTTAIGANSVASGTSATAVGNLARALRDESIAIGANSLAQAQEGTAIGASAVVVHNGSTAIGANSRSTAENQVTLGGAGSSVRVGDIAASTAAQEGPVEAVTVDANGTLGSQSVASAASVQRMGATVADALVAVDDRSAALQGQVNALFDLREADRRDFRKGVAAAVALAPAPMPSQPGRTSYTSNVSTFRGEVGFSLSVAHRIRSENPFAFTAGVSHAGGRNTAARVGVAGEF